LQSILIEDAEDKDRGKICIDLFCLGDNKDRFSEAEDLMLAVALDGRRFSAACDLRSQALRVAALLRRVTDDDSQVAVFVGSSMGGDSTKKNQRFPFLGDDMRDSESRGLPIVGAAKSPAIQVCVRVRVIEREGEREAPPGSKFDC